MMRIDVAQKAPSMAFQQERTGRQAALIGALGAIIVFTALTRFALGLFTGGGIVIAWLLSWGIGVWAAHFVSRNPTWKEELSTALVIALVVGFSTVAFFKAWLWW